MGKEKQDVVVVGAGMVGISCALHLQRRGFAVTVVDRLAPGEATSFGNAGVLAPSSVVPVPTPGIAWKIPWLLLNPRGPLFLRWSYLPRFAPWAISYLLASRRDKVAYIARHLSALLGDCVERHHELAQGTAAERWLRRCDYHFIFKDRRAFEADAFTWNLRREHGAVWETLDAAALRAAVPGLGSSHGFGVALKNHGMIANPGQYVKDLAGHFVAEGGILTRGEVQEFEATSPRSVEVASSAGRLTAKYLVVAAGPWSARLARQAGLKIPLESERGYHVELQEPSVVPECPVMVADGKFVATPMTGGLRLAGLAEFGGLDAPASARPPKFLLERAGEIFPGLSFSARSEWLGHRPVTPDSLPVLGPAPDRPNILFAFGHHHVGMMGGPKTGAVIADLVSGGSGEIDVAPYRAERFAP